MKTRNGGWSLAEAMVTAAVLVIVVGTIFGAFELGEGFWRYGSTQVALHSELRYALESVSRELADAGGGTLQFVGSPDSQGWYPEVRFKVPQDGPDPEEGPSPPSSSLAQEDTVFWGNSSTLEWSGVVIYQWDSQKGQLIRKVGETTTVLAHRVSQVGFRLQPQSSQPVIEFRMALSGGGSRGAIKSSLGRWDPALGAWVGMPRFRVRN